jgi:hypothetical protein
VAELITLHQQPAQAATAGLNLAAVRSRIAVVSDRARKARESDDIAYSLHNYELALDHATLLLYTLLDRVEDLEQGSPLAHREAA